MDSFYTSPVTVYMYIILCSLILSHYFCQVEAAVDKAYKNFSDKLSDALKVLSATNIII